MGVDTLYLVSSMSAKFSLKLHEICRFRQTLRVTLRHIQVELEVIRGYCCRSNLQMRVVGFAVNKRGCQTEKERERERERERDKEIERNV